MGWDGAGGYTRQHNFSADASVGINILAARMDTEFNDVASAITIAWARNGQNVPTQAIPMGGQRFINVGAATSVGNYMRVREFIENVPIFMNDAEASADRISVSAQYFTSVSANQAPGDGTRILVRAGSTKASAVLYLNGHSANVEFQDGSPAVGVVVSGGIYEFIFSSVDVAWKIQNPEGGRTAAEITAGVTPTHFQYEPGDIRRYGAVLDGTADDTTAVTNWAAVGGTLKFPVAGTARVTAVIPLVSNTTIEAVSGATIRQVTANTSVLTASSKSNIRINGLTLHAVGSMSSYFNGCGAHFDGCTNVRVVGCTVTNHRGWGVQFYNSNYCLAEACRFTSSPATDSDNHEQLTGDISFAGDASNNIARGNWCISGNGIGVSVHGLISTDNADNNVVIGNIIDACRIYGVEVYKTDISSSVVNNVVVNNVITNISGATEHATDGFIFGAGIYVQGAEDTTVQGNNIRGTHTASETFVDQLAPGAIGSTNCTRFNIKGNHIEDANMYGITVRDPSTEGAAVGIAVIEGNTLSNVTNAGIQVHERGRVSVIGNTINTCDRGIYVSNTTAADDLITIANNIIRTTVGHAIQVAFVRGLKIIGNLIRAQALGGIFVDDSSQVTITDNQVANGSAASGSRGLVIASTDVTDGCFIDGNSFTDNEIGMLLDGQNKLGKNDVFGNGTQYSGAFPLVRTLDDTGTPSVLNGRNFVTGGTTTITAFDDGEAGQEIIIRVAHSLTIDVTGTTIIGGTADLAVAAGDILHFVTDDGTNWRLISFMDMSDDYSSGT